MKETACFFADRKSGKLGGCPGIKNKTSLPGAAEGKKGEGEGVF